jgi:cytoskeletal protein RodZ
MAVTESLRQVAHGRASWSAWFGIVLLFALFGVIVLAIIGPSPRGSDYEETRSKKRVENLKTLREEADKALTTYGWIDKDKGTARIPIERAMEVTVADLAKQTPAPAGPIATPAAQPAASAPASAASPPPTSPSPAKSP